MLKLVVADEKCADMPDFNSLAAEAQYDSFGRICTVVLSLNGSYWLRVPSVATFHFCKTSDEIQAFPENSIIPRLLQDVYQRLVLPMSLQALGIEVLHASAVTTEKGVFAFCASSGTGKSTCAAALKRRGYRVWADDALAFRIENSIPWSLALPFQSRLLPETISFLHRMEKRPEISSPYNDSAPLAGVFILNRDKPANHVQRVGAGESLQLLLSHSWCFSLNDQARKRSMLENYLALAARTPIMQMQFLSGLEHLSSALDSIEEVMQASSG